MRSFINVCLLKYVFCNNKTFLSAKNFLNARDANLIEEFFPIKYFALHI